MKRYIIHQACFLLLLLISTSRASSYTEADLAALSIKLEVNGKPVEYRVIGIKLDRELIPIRPLSEDFNIDDMGKTADKFWKILQDPIEAFIYYKRLQRDDPNKAHSLFLAADDIETDPQALAILNNSEMRARMKEHLKLDFSVQPILLIKIGDSLVDIYLRIAGATPEGVAYSVIDIVPFKKIGGEWKILSRTLSEDNPKTVMSWQIIGAFNKDAISIELTTAEADK